MRYIDVFDEAYWIKDHHPYKDVFHAQLDIRVLAWTANHEHAVFHLHTVVHPATVCVWFEYRKMVGGEGVDHICKIQLKKGKWKNTEFAVGRVPFVNNNPFDPRKDNAASNTAESVFPQNQ